MQPDDKSKTGADATPPKTMKPEISQGQLNPQDVFNRTVATLDKALERHHQEAMATIRENIHVARAAKWTALIAAAGSIIGAVIHGIIAYFTAKG